MRKRLDLVLVERGLASSRSEAAALVESSSVLVSGAIALKTSRLVSADEPVVVTARRRFVSRGGEKLEHALSVFGLDVAGRHVLDAGASTGGFTDCVLQRGAAAVFAVDVGRHQLHERISSDARVVSREGVNVRDLAPDDLPFPCSLVVADLSFISLRSVVARLVACASPEEGHPVAQLVLLVKPQFEVGRTEVSRGRGIVTDPGLRARAVEDVRCSVEETGARVIGVVESPITGAEGNIEFLMLVECPGNP